jgi:hypothetical protein
LTRLDSREDLKIKNQIHEIDRMSLFLLYIVDLQIITTDNNVSVTSWWSLLFVEEIGEDHGPVSSH